MKQIRHFSILLIALVLLNGCIHIGHTRPVHTTITGRVIHQRTGRPVPSITVEVLDVRPRFSLFGIPGPIPIGVATTSSSGYFKLSANGTFRRDHIAVQFRDTSNLDALQSGVRIIDVSSIAFN